MNPMPKTHPYRSQKLRDAAKLVPHCMNPDCHAVNDGGVVLAHSNHLRDGKGRGLKAHDVPCYLCMDCHNELDTRPNQDTERMRLETVYDSTVWCLQEGVLK